MKKRPIGFFNASETKCKDCSDKEHNDENEQQRVPEELVDEIEGHVLAKQEYENSMRKLYNYEQSLKCIVACFTAIAFAAALYFTYKWGYQDCKADMEKIAEMKQTFEKIYIDAYNVGYKDKTDNKANNATAHIKYPTALIK